MDRAPGFGRAATPDRGLAADRGSTADRGSAAIIGAFAAAGVVAVTAMILQVATAVSVAHGVRAAADLAAISAATALNRGDAAACSAAQRVTDHAGVTLATCRAIGWDVEVQVSSDISLGPFGVRLVEAAARAGPADRDDR